MKNRFWILAVMACLAACTSVPGVGDGKHPPKWKPSNVLRFGDWMSNPGSCKLVGNSPEVKTVTDGDIEKDQIELRMAFAVPLAGAPSVSISNLPVAVDLEGSGQSYTVRLPYNPTSVAHYMQGDSFLTVAFTPAQNSDGELEVNFGLSGLVSGVTYLGRTCK